MSDPDERRQYMVEWRKQAKRKTKTNGSGVIAPLSYLHQIARQRLAERFEINQPSYFGKEAK